MKLELLGVMPFARGGNRLCYVHPEKPDVCVKVRRPDFSIIDLRKKKGFPKSLKPLSSFDDNAEEFRVLSDFEKSIGAEVFAHICRCYGYQKTDMGLGLCVELVRDHDGRVSKTLKQVIWDDGYDEQLQQAVECLKAHWIRYAVPSRDLLLHNIVVQRSEKGIERLVVIDGLGASGILPSFLLPRWYCLLKARRKIENLDSRIQDLLASRATGEFPAGPGRLIHDGVAKHGS